MAQRALDKDIQYVKGVGPSRARHFARLGVATVGDLLNYFPVRHEDRRALKRIAALEDGAVETFRGLVRGSSERRPRRGLSITTVTVTDGSAIARLVWFNQPYIAKRFPVGQWFIFTGKVARRSNGIQVSSVEYEEYDSADPVNTGRLVPVYGLTEGLTQRAVRAVTKAAVDEYAGAVTEYLPLDIRTARGLVPIADAISSMHFPAEESALEQARRRLAFDELFTLQVALASVRKSASTKQGIAHSPDGLLAKRFVDSLPFRLTGAQARVVDEIRRDMERPVPMNRLLMGDVGSGKTVVAALALLKAVESGYQGALMAPTEVLAEQHYANVGRLLGGAGVRVVALSGSQSSQERESALQALASGEAQVAVGTHALIQEGVEFKALSLAVTDEQHRFGVRQRALLQQKGYSPDVLVMTATPIPRTLALTVFGDLDVSVIDELPPGRKPVKTLWRREDAREKVYAWLRSQVEAGRQAYVVCPVIEESESVATQAATDLKADLERGALRGIPMGLLHGRMRPDEKRREMEEFKRGSTRVLVATTVIEVGVDVPAASIMIIEGAERFGLAQLHQLRGRVGRGSQQSYCVLLCGAVTPEAEKRMETMASVADGFRIAEADLEMRGPGEFFGARQHGVPDFRVANPVRDVRILEEAREDAFRLIDADPGLAEGSHAALRIEVARRFKDLGLFTIG